MKKKVFLSLLGVIFIIIAVFIFNTTQYASKQLNLSAVKPMTVKKQGAAKRLAEIIPFPTISYENPEIFDKQAFWNLHHKLEENFPLVHQYIGKETINEMSLLYTWKGSNPKLKPILLMAHQDIVPIEPGTEKDWQYPPFSGEIAEGYVWGRGSMDDKMGVTGILEAAETLIRSGFSPQRTIYFAFGHDEEAGGRQGMSVIASLLRNRGIQLEMVLDEGGLIYNNELMGIKSKIALVGTAEKGYLSLKLMIQGKGGHSSMPPDHTSVGLLSHAVYQLECHQRPGIINGATEQMLDYLGPEMPFFNRMLLANRWFFNPFLLNIFKGSPESAAIVRTTTAATLFHAGVKDNVIPQKAYAIINFRIIPGETIKDITEHVRKIINNPKISIIPVEIQKEASPVSSTQSNTFKCLHKTIKEIFPGVLVSPYLAIGATDSRYFYPLCDNVYRFAGVHERPGDMDRVHGTNERQSIDDYIKHIQFLIRLIENTQNENL